MISSFEFKMIYIVSIHSFECLKKAGCYVNMPIDSSIDINSSNSCPPTRAALLFVSFAIFLVRGSLLSSAYINNIVLFCPKNDKYITSVR